jgi:hypothetical protein
MATRATEGILAPMTNDLDANGNPIEPPIRTLEEELVFVDPLGWAHGEMHRLTRFVLAIWEGEPEPAAILNHVMIRLGARGSPGTCHTMKILLALATQEIAQAVAELVAERR